MSGKQPGGRSRSDAEFCGVACGSTPFDQTYTPFGERKCPLCNLNDIGDDFHYLLKCSFFETDRKELLKQYFYTRTNIIKFQHLLASTNKNILTKLSKFMKIIMNKFANVT